MLFNTMVKVDSDMHPTMKEKCNETIGTLGEEYSDYMISKTDKAMVFKSKRNARDKETKYKKTKVVDSIYLYQNFVTFYISTGDKETLHFNGNNF